MAILTRTTGYLVTSEDWNELVNAINATSVELSVDITDCFYLPTEINAAGIEQVNSGIGTPAPCWNNVLFDAGTTEYMKYKFVVPENWGAGGTLKIGFYGTATSGSVVFQAGVVGLGAAQATSCNFGTAVLGTFTVNGTAGVRTLGTLAFIDLNGIAAGAKAMLYLERIGTATADNAGGDCKVDKVMFCYES